MEFPLRALGPAEHGEKDHAGSTWEISLLRAGAPALAREVPPEAHSEIVDGRGDGDLTLGYHDLYLLAKSVKDGGFQHAAARSPPAGGGGVHQAALPLASRNGTSTDPPRARP